MFFVGEQEMKPWEERTFPQQLTIILCFISVLLVIYFLLVKALGFLLTVVLPLLILWVILWDPRKILHRSSHTTISTGSPTDIQQSSKLPMKENLVIWAGVIFCVPLSICLFKSHLIFGIVWSIGLTVIVVKNVLENMRRKQQQAAQRISPTGSIGCKFVKYISIAILWIWMIGFLSPFFSAVLSFSGIPMPSSIIRTPLGIPGGIAVDVAGRIYYVSNSYNRIQVYDKNGRFLRGWFFTIPGNLSKTVQVIIDEKNRIHVEAGYYKETYPINDPNRKVYTVFTQNGKLLERRSETFSYMKIPDAFERKAPDGNIHKVKHRLFFPKVLRISPSGKEIVIVSDPIYLKLIDFPVPSAVCILAISISYGIWEFWQKKKKAKENKNPETFPTN